jgi:hypothetical protein
VQHRRRIEIFDKNIYQEKKKTDGRYDFFLSFFLLAAQRVIEFLEIPFKKQNFIIYTRLAHSGEGQL